ncbi:hypothetical protein CRUP_013839, partial [Coryphaenoides rupestris]
RTEAGPASSDDLYLDDAGSGGYYPEDDDDFNSGSGSGGGGGGGEEDAVAAVAVVVVAVETATRSTVYIQPKDAAPTMDSAKDSTAQVEAATASGSPSGLDILKEIMPRNPVRTEAPAVSTEKDEGSYDLGERKPAGAAYQKAPTKEFYA